MTAQTGTMAVHVVNGHHDPGHESISSAASEVEDAVEVKAGSSVGKLPPSTRLSPVSDQPADSARSSPRSSPNDDIQTATTHTSASIYPSNDSSSHKRKRSGDDTRTSSPHRSYDYSPPARTEHPQHVADQALHMLGTSNNTTQEYHTNGNGMTHGRDWDDHYSPEPQSASTHTPNGEEQQRWESHSNGQNYNHDSMAGTNGGRVRKRNFSNRTKTGCLTCRTRKKKCDEARPHCMFSSSADTETVTDFYLRSELHARQLHVCRIQYDSNEWPVAEAAYNESACASSIKGRSRRQ